MNPKVKAKAVDELAASSNGGAPDPPDLDDPRLFINRQTSWMEFNDRVLQLIEDKGIPLLERLKFASIYESNLDEFFMVRVAGLHDLVEAGVAGREADGLSAAEQIAKVREMTIEQRKRLDQHLDSELWPALAEHGIRILSHADASAEELARLDEIFEAQIFPALTPLVLGMGRPFPYISNLSLSLLVFLRDPEGDVETDILARVKVPKELLGRFVPLDDGTSFVAIEDVIAQNLEALFPGMEITGSALFRVTRDTDYDVSGDADDLRQAVEDEIRRRRFGEVVRVELSKDFEPRMRERLLAALKVDESQVYETDGLLGLDDLGDIVGVDGFDKLRHNFFAPVTQAALHGEDGAPADIMGAMREGDIFVHHPYDSFNSSVEQFIKQAVADPDVLAIKQTVYRTSADSPLVPAMIEASEKGKQAVCMVELKARFDEAANITWAKKLEQAGVHVVYGIPALKTHAKCALVARREGDGVRHYAHIGTGNYNPKTAKLYTDFGIFTANKKICADIALMFNYLTGYARPKRYKRALIAPHNLVDRLLEEIDATAESHSKEHPARIRMKMNALLDPGMIQALYRASQAGVRIELNIRGICALRPGIKGVSDNIEVVSVLGRFLEHSRVYAFERKDETKIFMGSADLMQRNLYSRVELMIPVEDEVIREELLAILELSLADNVGAWTLGPDGEWSRRGPGDDDEPLSVQAQMIARARLRAADIAL